MAVEPGVLFTPNLSARRGACRVRAKGCSVRSALRDGAGSILRSLSSLASPEFRPGSIIFGHAHRTLLPSIR